MVRFLPAVLLLASSAWADDLDSQVKRLVSAFALVEENAADPISSEQVFYQGVIPGMLRRLDPHSVFFDPQQFEQLKQLETSTRKGFGSVVSVLPGRVIVLQTLPGTPSAKSGVFMRRFVSVRTSASTLWPSALSSSNETPSFGLSYFGKNPGCPAGCHFTSAGPLSSFDHGTGSRSVSS